MPFPREFPAEAAKTVGTALLTRSLGREHLEPAYDLQGYAEYRIIGVIPAPQPSPPTPERKFGEGLEDEEAVGRMLLAAADVSENGKFAADADPTKGLPWAAILDLLIRFIAVIR